MQPYKTAVSGLVDAGDGVGEGELVAPLGGAVGVAEAGHVDAEELQLGRHVGAVEGGAAADEAVGHHPGLGVAGADEAVDAATDGGALADGVDVGIGGDAPLVGEDAAALAELEVGGPGQLVPGPDPGRVHDHVGGQRCAVGEGESLDPGPAARGPGCPRRRGADDGGGRLRRVHGDVHRLDGAPQRLAAAVVDLEGHEPGGELDDVGLQPEPEQRPGRLEAEEAILNAIPLALKQAIGVGTATPMTWATVSACQAKPAAGNTHRASATLTIHTCAIAARLTSAKRRYSDATVRPEAAVTFLAWRSMAVTGSPGTNSMAGWSSTSGSARQRSSAVRPAKYVDRLTRS